MAKKRGRPLNQLALCGDYPCMTGRKNATPPAAQLYDEWLVVMVQSGDRAAANQLARRWHPRLARTALRLLGDAEAAPAAVQECWIAILRGIGRLRDPSRFAPWAFGILRRRCADHIRSAQRARAHVGELTGEPSDQAPADDAVAIRHAFAALPTDQRFAAQLFFVEGLTLAEIAQVQGIPLGTAKTRLFHARRKLKAALSGDDT